MTPFDSSRNIEKLIRSQLAELGGYNSHKSPDTLAGKTAKSVSSIIKLDANENPYGCSPRVKKALAEYENWHIYPDAGQTLLRLQLQEYTGIDAGRIVAADGSGELLDDIMCLFLEPGDEVINCVPTFDMYRFRTLINGGDLVNVPRDDGFAVDIKAVKSALTTKTKLIIVSNPNNPTGNVIPRKDIMEMVDIGIPLLIDEAYYEFSGDTVVPLISECRNLMVLRTFSKWAGIAGLRIGYGVFPAGIAGFLMKIKLPYNVNTAALIAVRETLKDIDYLKSKMELIITERERLFKGLTGQDWLKPLPSSANFIYCSIIRGKAQILWQKLQDRGIMVRYFDQPLLQNSVRISVGKPEHTDALLAALRELEGELDG